MPVMPSRDGSDICTEMLWINIYHSGNINSEVVGGNTGRWRYAPLYTIRMLESGAIYHHFPSNFLHITSTMVSFIGCWHPFGCIGLWVPHLWTVITKTWSLCPKRVECIALQ